LLAGRIALHHAGAHRQDVRAVFHHVERVQVRLDTLEDDAGMFVVHGIGDELVAADARDHVRLAKRLAKHKGRVAQRGVSPLVAELVVDAFQAVDVGEDDGAVDALASRDHVQVFGLDEETAAVMQTREHVGERQRVQRARRFVSPHQLRAMTEGGAVHLLALVFHQALQ
jgi:hypothetical protein